MSDLLCALCERSDRPIVRVDPNPVCARCANALRRTAERDAAWGPRCPRCGGFHR